MSDKSVSNHKVGSNPVSCIINDKIARSSVFDCNFMTTFHQRDVTTNTVGMILSDFNTKEYSINLLTFYANRMSHILSVR